MKTQTNRLCEKPAVWPRDACHSSRSCKKHPGVNLSQLSGNNQGRSHHASTPKSRLQQAITHSAKLLELPEDWPLAILPASDTTGAFKLALWSILGCRGVDVPVWESYPSDWDYQRWLNEEYFRKAA